LSKGGLGHRALQTVAHVNVSYGAFWKIQKQSAHSRSIAIAVLSVSEKFCLQVLAAESWTPMMQLIYLHDCQCRKITELIESKYSDVCFVDM
jgi:hypothetical protein